MHPLIVYTAIIGNTHDTLHPLPELFGLPRPAHYICYSDWITPDIAPPGWEIRRPLWEHENPRRTARWHKIQAHEALGGDVEYSLWLDGSHQLLVDPWTLVDKYLSAGIEMATFKHPERDCVYDELTACMKLRKDDPTIMGAQVTRYRKEKYPSHNGLFETSVMLRKHTMFTIAFNQRWWDEVKAGSLRDQLSVNYAWHMKPLELALNQNPMSYIAGSRTKSPYFRFYPHR